MRARSDVAPRSSRGEAESAESMRGESARFFFSGAPDLAEALRATD